MRSIARPSRSPPRRALALLGFALIASAAGCRTTPSPPGPEVSKTQLALDYGQACWVEHGGGVRCERGLHPDQEFRPLVGLERDVTAIVAGWFHDCARRSDATFWCWGMNDEGQLGQPKSFDPSPPVALVAPLNPYVALSAGKSHTCAIDGGDLVWCFGDLLASGPTPVRVPISGARPVDIASGDDHACVRRSDGSVACWGKNQKGQLGDPTSATTFSAAPLEVALPAAAATVSLGMEYGCARLVDGEVWCWGTDEVGQLGDVDGEPDGGTALSKSPRRVEGIPRAVELSAGEHHACVLAEDASIWCWGDNASRQLGFSSSGIARAGRASGIPPAAQIAAGRGIDSCALTIDGEVWCWGAVPFYRQPVDTPQRVGKL